MEALEALPQRSHNWFSPASLQVSLNGPLGFPEEDPETGAGWCRAGASNSMILASGLHSKAGQILPRQAQQTT